MTNEQKIRQILQEAVDLYGKPGGPWNVPNDPGGWISRAREVLSEKISEMTDTDNDFMNLGATPIWIRYAKNGLVRMWDIKPLEDGVGDMRAVGGIIGEYGRYRALWIEMSAVLQKIDGYLGALKSAKEEWQIASATGSEEIFHQKSKNLLQAISQLLAAGKEETPKNDEISKLQAEKEELIQALHDALTRHEWQDGYKNAEAVHDKYTWKGCGK